MKKLFGWINHHGVLFAAAAIVFLFACFVLVSILVASAWKLDFQKDWINRMYQQIEDEKKHFERKLALHFREFYTFKISNIDSMSIDQLKTAYYANVPDVFTDIVYTRTRTNIFCDSNYSPTESHFRQLISNKILYRIGTIAKEKQSNELLQWVIHEVQANHLDLGQQLQLLLTAERQKYHLSENICFRIGYSNVGFMPATVYSTSLSRYSGMISFKITKPDGSIIIPALYNHGRLVNFVCRIIDLQPGTSYFQQIFLETYTPVFTQLGRYRVQAECEYVKSEPLYLTIIPN